MRTTSSYASPRIIRAYIYAQDLRSVIRSGTLGDTVTTSGTITGTLAPGTAKDFPIAKKSLERTAGYVTSRETRAAVDGCMGGVQVRMYATATIFTALGIRRPPPTANRSSSNATTPGTLVNLRR